MMKSISSEMLKLTVIASLCTLIIAVTADLSTAQRVSYEALKRNEGVPTAYFDYNIFPPASPGEDALLVVSFKLGHDFLNFRRDSENSADSTFFADVEIGMEVYGVESSDNSRQESEELYTDRIQESRGSRRAEDRRTSRTGDERESLGREFWNGTAYAGTYEQTQSSHQHLEGYITKTLAPGDYEITSRFNSDQRTRNTLPKSITIPDFTEKGASQVYFLDETTDINLPANESLINMGRNVFYGKDFNALLLIPEYDEQSEYRLQLKKLELDRQDTSSVTVYDEVLSNSDIHTGLDLNLNSNQNGAVQISLTGDDTPYTYALKQIPNSKFENANYRMEVWQINEAEEKKMLGNRRFLNRWIDIPTSLLNVDVAINMMRFIVDDETLSKLKDGNERERERKFREFWSARNPTPETEYNELMVEYYERIDYAFENYTTPGNPGYESDMGKVYIQNGKPNNITRRFPSNQPAVEIWEYDTRRFRFEATSGFGDYQLRETR